MAWNQITPINKESLYSACAHSVHPRVCRPAPPSVVTLCRFLSSPKIPRPWLYLLDDYFLRTLYSQAQRAAPNSWTGCHIKNAASQPSLLLVVYQLPLHSVLFYVFQQRNERPEAGIRKSAWKQSCILPLRFDLEAFVGCVAAVRARLTQQTLRSISNREVPGITV